MIELYRTNLVPAYDLEVSIDCVTYAQEVNNGYSLLYRFEMRWHDLLVVSGSMPLEAIYEGTEESVLLELPSLEAAKAVGERWHQIGEVYGTKYKFYLQGLALAKIAEKMG